MDFTLKTYKQLLTTLYNQNYTFQTFLAFVEDPADKAVILRHDVDRLPQNALKMANIEKESGIKCTYFFRTVKATYKPDIIKEISESGHEIGYHYENLSSIAGRKNFRNYKTLGLNPQIPNPKAMLESAIQDFEQNLKKFRMISPIKTICMHGSPLSKYDSRHLWKVYDYRDYGIIADPYFDVDFNIVLYLTDTGRKWDGEKVSIRDQVVRGEEVVVTSEKTEIRSREVKKLSTPRPFNLIPNALHSTFDIVAALESDLLPDHIMINTHPQRWTDNAIPWVKELVFQNLKNVIKKRIKKKRLK